MKAYLILEDGTVFTGESFGARTEVISEIVFNTSMTGYLEVLTDPSYAGQAVTMTYPLIGNYGINYQDMESKKAQPDGFIVREIAGKASNFRNDDSLTRFLVDQGITGIYGIDTRALTRILRESGTMNGMITTDETKLGSANILNKIKRYRVEGVVERVSCKEKEIFEPRFARRPDKVFKPEFQFKNDFVTETKYKIALMDFGAKKNIVDSLLRRGCEVTVYPQNTKAEEIFRDKPDGIMLSNGPGDPAECTDIIEELKKLFDGDIPIFGICLGHQLMALAKGGRTEKMKYGHRGANHPVKDLSTGRVYISTQNHGYMVVDKSMPEEVATTSFINVNDGTVEGIRYTGKRIFTVQFHPEACSGPLDTGYLFDEFLREVNDAKNN